MLYTSYKKTHRKAKRFCHLNHLQDLEALLQCEAYKLLLLGQSPPYSYFSIPKKNGKMRSIEAPQEPLMGIQRKLNTFLQSVYYFHKTNAAYGFLLNLKKDPAPRHIISNAQRHIGQNYLLNVDMKDFFHQVTWQKVHHIFAQAPFNFDHKLAMLLAHLTTNNGRLPMGAPTSPVLSNFATRFLDQELLAYALRHHFTYTRYADDLSFSHKDPITTQHYQAINEIIQSHAFELNPQKVKFYGKKSPKIVTGLHVSDTIEVAAEYLLDLDKNTQKLATIMEIKYATGTPTYEAWLEKFIQHIEGKINFLSMVYGNYHPHYIKAVNQYHNAIEEPDDLEIMQDWLDFPYHI